MSVHLKPAFSPDTEKGYVIEDVFPSLTRRNSSKIEISLLKQAIGVKARASKERERPKTEFSIFLLL